MPVLFALGLLASVSGAACRQDMHDQPKVKAYREADSSPIAAAIARCPKARCPAASCKTTI